MNQQLEEIKEALSKATPGPWEDYGPPHAKQIYAAGNDSTWLCQLWYKSDEPMPNSVNNAHFIANAPQWLASLVSEVEEMQKTLEHQKELLHIHINTDHWKRQFDTVYKDRQLEIGRHASTKLQVEQMQKIIDTAVMFLQSNELNIKAEQIKAMSQSLKGDKP